MIVKTEKELSEKQVESRLKKRIEKEIKGAVCWKFVSPGQSGVPDRVILLPDGLTVWVELKRPGATARPLQVAVMAQIQRIGHEVFVVDSYKQVEQVVDHCKQLVSLHQHSEVCNSVISL